MIDRNIVCSVIHTMSQNRGNMNISIALNHNYTKYAYVLLTSLFYHHKDAPDCLTVYLLSSDLTDEDRSSFGQLADRYRQTIVFLQVDPSDEIKKLPTTENWSKEMYYRLLYGELLPQEVSRILYLDVDVIVNGPLFAFYQTDLGGKLLGVADDPMIQGNFSPAQQRIFSEFPQTVRYFNSGVILFDLEKLRKRYKFADYMRAAAKFSFQLTNPDQDLLNYLHADEVCFFDNRRYNVFSQLAEMDGMDYARIREECTIIHYAGRKPWNYNGVHYSTERLWWDYAKMTPFYFELMEPVFLQGLNDESYQSMMALLKENSGLKQNLDEAVALCQKLYGMLNT